MARRKKPKLTQDRPNIWDYRQARQFVDDYVKWWQSQDNSVSYRKLSLAADLGSPNYIQQFIAGSSSHGHATMTHPTQRPVRHSPLLAVLLLLTLPVACVGGGVSVGTGGQEKDTALPGSDGVGDDGVVYEPIAAELATSHFEIRLVDDWPLPASLKVNKDDDNENDDNEDDNDNENDNENGNGNGNESGNGQGAGAANKNERFELEVDWADAYLTQMSFKTNAWFICDDIEAEAGMLLPTCESGRVTFSGPWRAQLEDGSFDPAFAGLMLLVTEYTEAHLSLDRNTEANVVFAGRAYRFADEASVTPDETIEFQVSLSLPGDIKLRALEPIAVTAAEAQTLAILVSQQRWLAGVAEDVFKCAASKKAVFGPEDGVLYIDETKGGGQCNGIAGNLKSNFVSSASFSAP